MVSELKIDFVIPWVDDNDSEWLKDREAQGGQKASESVRYRDWGLLKYWFRGIEEFAPWVNNIYFVTHGHIPDFLNVDHPKIKIVKHADYIPHEYLPTFSANPIELNLHRIEGLSEHFVYFNDDTYLIKPVKKEDFFENGLPKDVAIMNPIVPKFYNSASNIMANDIAVINDNFRIRNSVKSDKLKWFNVKYGRLLPLNFLFLPWPSCVGLYQQHLPSSFLKSTFEKVWNKEYEVLHQTSKRKFRNNFMDVNQWLLKEWQIMEGNFTPRSIHFGKYIMIRERKDVRKFEKYTKNKKIKIICLNDHVYHDDLDKIITDIDNTFNSFLGQKSSFEK